MSPKSAARGMSWKGFANWASVNSIFGGAGLATTASAESAAGCGGSVTVSARTATGGSTSAAGSAGVSGFTLFVASGGTSATATLAGGGSVFVVSAGCAAHCRRRVGHRSFRLSRFRPLQVWLWLLPKLCSCRCFRADSPKIPALVRS